MNTAIIISENELNQKLTAISENIVSKMVDEIRRSHPPQREVMKIEQLAEYWQVTKQSIWNWARRAENPLPIHYVGGDPRFHLLEVDAWSKMEAIRRLNKSEEMQESSLIQ